MLKHGLWEARRNGYFVHDYPRYNPTKAEVMQARENKSRAGRIGAIRSADSRRRQKAPAEAPAEAGVKANRHTPSPSPTTNTNTKPLASPVQANSRKPPEPCPRGRGERGLEHPAHPECVIVTPDSVPCYPSAALRAAWLHVEDGCPRTAHLDRFPPDLRRQCPAHRESPLSPRRSRSVPSPSCSDSRASASTTCCQRTARISTRPGTSGTAVIPAACASSRPLTFASCAHCSDGESRAPFPP